MSSISKDLLGLLKVTLSQGEAMKASLYKEERNAYPFGKCVKSSRSPRSVCAAAVIHLWGVFVLGLGSQEETNTPSHPLHTLGDRVPLRSINA